MRDSSLHALSCICLWCNDSHVLFGGHGELSSFGRNFTRGDNMGCFTVNGSRAQLCEDLCQDG